MKALAKYEVAIGWVGTLGTGALMLWMFWGGR